MHITDESLALRFKKLSDDDLLQRLNAQELSEQASALAIAELAARGIDYSAMKPGDEAEETEAPESALDYVTLARFTTAFEAHVLRTRLEEEGIDAIVADEHLGTANIVWSSAQGGIRVQIPAAQWNAAVKVMEDKDAGQYELPDPDAAPATTGGPWTEAMNAYTLDPYYAEHWRKRMLNHTLLAGFNLSAFVFGPAWFFFRKMYRLGWIYMLASFFAFYLPMLADSLLFHWSLGDGVGYFRYGWLSEFLLARIPMALSANLLYFTRAKRALESIGGVETMSAEKLKTMKSLGGINFLASLLIAMLGIVLWGISNQLRYM